MALLAFQHDKKLGVADNSARYDLPLHNSAGCGFLLLLVALMSFLAMMTMTGAFAMHGVTSMWSSGLENQATIEIPARMSDGELRDKNELSALRDKLNGFLADQSYIESYEVMSREAVADLVSPWLGDDVNTAELPLPVLISVKLEDSSADILYRIRQNIRKYADDIRLDTHESWLSDILRLAGSLQFSAVIVTLIIGATTVIAIAGAVRSRMAEFRGDIELLHLMGASSTYISSQFQRHSVILSFKGSIIGIITGALALGLFSILSPSGAESLVPALHLGLFEWIILLLIPVAACLIAHITAKITVLRTLSELPL